MSVGSYVHQTRDSGMLNIQPSAVHSQALREFGQLVPKAAAAAQRRAINKTLGWLRTHIARAVGKQERIAIGAVRQRLRAYPVSGGTMRGKLWFGVNAIEASRIGKARQTRAGVSVAGRRYQGAFFKQVYGSSPDIWIRTSSKHFNSTDYPDSSQGRRRSGFIEESDNRLSAPWRLCHPRKRRCGARGCAERPDYHRRRIICGGGSLPTWRRLPRQQLHRWPKLRNEKQLHARWKQAGTLQLCRRLVDWRGREY